MLGKIEKLTVTSATIVGSNVRLTLTSPNGTSITRLVSRKFVGKWPNVGQSQDARIQLIDGTRS